METTNNITEDTNIDENIEFINTLLNAQNDLITLIVSSIDDKGEIDIETNTPEWESLNYHCNKLKELKIPMKYMMFTRNVLGVHKQVLTAIENNEN